MNIDTEIEVVEVVRGQSPLILGLPHTGIFVPDEIFNRLNNTGKQLTDTDWHVHKLYDGLVENLTSVRALFHRYVIDANRDPAGVSLYPGQNTTELCPTTDFDNYDIYLRNEAPDHDEIERRRTWFHQKYHLSLAAEIQRIKELHGFAILYDCHSIRSHVPHLFEGKLPDFNIGTFDGKTCSNVIEDTVSDICKSALNYTHILNGRFKGGWTTRNYGDPLNGVHAIQMELSQTTYMQEAAPWAYNEKLANKIRPHLKQILKSLSYIKLEPVG